MVYLHFLAIALGFGAAASAAHDFSNCQAELLKQSEAVQSALLAAEQSHPLHWKKLLELLRIPSFTGNHRAMLKTAKAVQKYFQRDVGLQTQLLSVPGAPPYVFAQNAFDPAKPTVLFYAHYDVVAAGSGWTVTDAFSPKEVDGRLYGRGTADDKAAIVLYGHAIAALAKAFGRDTLPVNVRVLVEGEEEVGCTHAEDLVDAHPEIFEGVDAVIVADSANALSGVPTVTTSLRGGLAINVTVKALSEPVHSGIFGGPTPNPQNALHSVLGSLVDKKDGTLAIPSLASLGFPRPSEAERETARVLAIGDEEFRQRAGFLPGAEVLGDPSLPVLLRLSHSPALQILWPGNPGTPKQIESEASAQLVFRVPAGVNSRAFSQLVQSHIAENVPWGLRAEFALVRDVPAWRANPQSPLVPLMGESLRLGFESERALYLGLGGTIGLLSLFERATGGAPALVIGIESPDSQIHGPNEFLDIPTYTGNLKGLVRFIDALGTAKRAALP